MRSWRLSIIALLVGAFAALAGCTWEPNHKKPKDEGGAAGGAGGDALTTVNGNGGNDGEPVCEGRCTEWKSALFEDLSMFWLGPPGQAPPCPDSITSHVGLIAYGDMTVAAHTCPACSCTPAGCALPEEMHVSAAKCANAQNAASIAWDSPAWEGVCTSEGGIPPGLLCGGVPCAQSLTVTPPTVEPCEPMTDGEEVKPNPSWALMAKECIIGPLTSTGCAGGEACVAPPPDGFSLCLYRFGDDLTAADCPATYPRYQVVHAEGAVHDTRACEPCACTAPEGAVCSALVSAYSDGLCGTMLAAVTVGLNDPACVDLPAAGVSLGSKEAVWTMQEPGTCEPSGGTPVGTVVPSVPVTLCCEPAQPPAP